MGGFLRYPASLCENDFTPLQGSINVSVLNTLFGWGQAGHSGERQPTEGMAVNVFGEGGSGGAVRSSVFHSSASAHKGPLCVWDKERVRQRHRESAGNLLVPGRQCVTSQVFVPVAVSVLAE